MFADFIEIGTCDFKTEIELNDNKKGYSIEPIKSYLDKLPNKKDCVKLNIAVSDHEGTAEIYFTPIETIKKYGIPAWAKGCSTINKYHPSVLDYCQKRNINLEEAFDSYQVNVKSLMNVIKSNNIYGSYFLKIDTEGHDVVILKKFAQDITDNSLLPHKILFESNTLTAVTRVNEIVDLYKNLGYDLIVRGYDTILKLNINKIKNKSKFTREIAKYFIENYPDNYDPENLPHENTLESAMNYCKIHNYSGVTYQYGRYEVRSGKYINYFEDDKIKSWIYV